MPFPIDGLPSGIEGYLQEWRDLGELDRSDVDQLQASLRLDITADAFAELESRSELAPELERAEQRCMAVATNLGLRIDGEVGQKYAEGDLARAQGGLLNVGATIAEAKRFLALGCKRVYIENAVIREVISDPHKREAGTEQIRQVVEAVGLDNIIIEINGSIMTFDAAQHSRYWAVKNFGPDVNMGGGEALIDVLFIEAVRRGISFIHGETKNPRLWVNSLARHGGHAAPEWWNEED